jgi:hypothetical protein
LKEALATAGKASRTRTYFEAIGMGKYTQMKKIKR